MEMSIDKLIVFCENLEKYHVTRCKRYDDASGYTRSRNEEIRANDAKREEMDSKFYHELKEIVRKYQKIEDIYYHQRGEALENSLRAVIEDGETNN